VSGEKTHQPTRGSVLRVVEVVLVHAAAERTAPAVRLGRS
jgi:hypothetical protein